MVLACSEKPFKRIEPPEAAQTIEDCRLTIVDLEERNQSEIFNLKSQIVGAGDRDRTGDVQLGKLAFYR